MTGLRIDATATLLANGKVLIAGGSPEGCDLAGCQALATAELYDPATGKFTPTGSMAWARLGASATLLPDGRVLVAGGYGCLVRKCRDDHTNNDLTATAEVYDPATGRFTLTGSMSTPRCWATGTLLADGRVLMLNGSSQLAETYDSSTGKFTKIGSLRNGYNGNDAIDLACPGTATATLLPNGKVLVVGQDSNDAAAELFDPASGKSAPVSLALPKDPAAKQDFYQEPQTASLLKDGRVLVFVWNSFGMYDYSDPPYSESDLLITYDPATNAFSQPTWIKSPARWSIPKAVSLADGSVLLTGGELGPDPSQDNYYATATAGIYDPVTGFHLISPMTHERSGQTVTVLADGSVLIAGGMGENTGSSAELFKP
jgi:Galactose oxidase, central domain